MKIFFFWKNEIFEKLKFLKKWKFWKFWKNENFEKMKILKKWKFWKIENFEKMKILKKIKILKNENFEKNKILKKWKFWYFCSCQQLSNEQLLTAVKIFLNLLYNHFLFALGSSICLYFGVICISVKGTLPPVLFFLWQS